MPLPAVGQPPLRETPVAPRFAVSEHFPVLAQLVGEPQLAPLERGFGAFLEAAGEANGARLLPTYLAGVPAFRDRPELAEVAAFEWALATSAAAPESPPLPPEELEGVTADAWPSLRIALHPALIRVGTEWNSVALWRAARQGTRLPRAVPEAGARTWAVWRQDGRTRFRALPPDDAWALDLAARGRPVGDIARALGHWLPARETGPFAARMLGDWLDAGWVTDLGSSHG